MKGTGRSIRYWIYNMEKVYGIMFLTVVAVLAFQCIGNGIHVLHYMSKTYFPMMGSLFLVAMLMSSANYYIPQSLSSGGTRREVFAGMELALHLMICQTLLLAVIVSKIALIGYADGKFLLGCTAFYLVFAGMGNLLCAFSLRFGTKVGMILYMVLVIGCGAVLGAVIAFDHMEIVRVGEEGIVYGAVAAVVIDLLMMGICYFSIRRYEIR